MSRYNVKECEEWQKIVAEKSRQIVREKAAIGAAKEDYSAEQFKLTKEDVEALNLPPQPTGYQSFIEDQKAGQVNTGEGSSRQTTKSQGPSFLDEYRNKLIFGAIVVAAIVLLYYIASPYENCVREWTSSKGMEEAKARMACGQRNTW